MSLRSLQRYSNYGLRSIACRLPLIRISRSPRLGYLGISVRSSSNANLLERSQSRSKRKPLRAKINNSLGKIQSHGDSQVHEKAHIHWGSLDLSRFRTHIANSDLQAVLATYPGLAEANALEPEDTCEIIRLLHHNFRLRSTVAQSTTLAEHVQSFLKSFKARKLPPHPRASLHVLAYFKESGQYDEGISFWNWVIKQDGGYVSLATCGAAIDLCAAYGRGLPYCEHVYEYALKRFPASFNEYHMSHGAILHRRDLLTTIPRTSMILLQGIISARFAYGDWRNAYLSLDTALRLHPTQVSSHFFRSVALKRPVPEVYQLFCLLCQSGSSMLPRDIGETITNLVRAQNRSSHDKLDLDIAMLVLNAIRLAIGNSINVNEIHLNIVLQTALFLLPVSQAGTGDTSDKLDEVTATQLYTQVLSLFSAMALHPNTATYRIMIKGTGELQDKAALLGAIAALKAANLPSSTASDTLNITLVAVAKTFGAAQVESFWQSRDPSIDLDVNNWRALARATAIAGNISFLQQELCESDFASDPANFNRIMSEASKRSLSDPESPDTVLPINRAACLSNAKTFSAALTSFLSILNSPNKTLKSQPPTLLSPYTPSSPIPESWQTALYDDLTLDPSSPAPQPTSPPEILPNGSTLAEVRYANWKGINQLLEHTSLFEERIKVKVDKAVEEGKSARAIRSTFSAKSPTENLTERHDHAREHLKMYFEDVQRMKGESVTKAGWIARVLELRRPKD